MHGMSGRRRRIIRDMVTQRARLLYRLAVNHAERGEVEEARRLVNLILRLSLSTRTRLPRHIRRNICWNCHAPLIPGVTARIRLRRSGRSAHISVVCLNCGWIHRYIYKPVRRSEAEEKKTSSSPGEARRDNR